MKYVDWTFIGLRIFLWERSPLPRLWLRQFTAAQMLQVSKKNQLNSLKRSDTSVCSQREWMSSNSAGLPSPRQTQSYQERRPGFCWHGGQISCHSGETRGAGVCRDPAGRCSLLPQEIRWTFETVTDKYYFSAAISFIPVDPIHRWTLAGTLFLLTTRQVFNINVHRQQFLVRWSTHHSLSLATTTIATGQWSLPTSISVNINKSSLLPKLIISTPRPETRRFDTPGSVRKLTDNPSLSSLLFFLYLLYLRWKMLPTTTSSYLLQGRSSWSMTAT